MNSTALNEIMTLSEAAELWNIDPSTIRHAIRCNKFDTTEIRKSHNTWLIAYVAMERIYGIINEHTDIYTIGYEGKSIEGFVSTLKANNIHTLFDVREYPLSRKRGFSKNQLSEYLSNNNIRYHSIRSLGSPKEVRDVLKKNWDYKEFFQAYENWLNTQPESFEIIKVAVGENCDKNFCLMCYEKNAAECHRSVLANRLVTSHEKITGIVNI